MNKLICIAAVVCLGGTGCAGVHVNFSPTGYAAGDRPARSPSNVAFFTNPEEPRCKYHVVGTYDGARTGAFLDPRESGITQAAIRKDAASQGFDGVLSFHCAEPGTVGFDYQACTGKAYVCE